MKISLSQRWFQLSRVSFYLNLNSRDPSPIYETSVVKVFVLFFSFSSFSGQRPLKIENENNSMKTKMQQFDHRNLIYGTIWIQEQVLVWQGKQAIRI